MSTAIDLVIIVNLAGGLPCSKLRSICRHEERDSTRCRVNLSTVLRGERFTFADLREVFAKANEEKSGDQLAGLAARSERERVAAKVVLADLTLAGDRRSSR